MNRDDLLATLADRGLAGADAEGALAVLAQKMRERERVEPLLLEAFGADAIRPVVILLVAAAEAK